MLRRTAVVAAFVVLACGRDHGPPKPRPAPKPDQTPALRGGGVPRSARIANYKIDATLDVGKHEIKASQTLTWTNTGTGPVDRLPFHLYLNAFKNESSLFRRSTHGEMRGAKAADNNWGYIQIDSVQIAGAELVSKLVRPNKDDPDETVVELPLPAPVEAGKSIDIAFKFTDKLPEVYARTGYKGEFHMVGQWFPKIGVRIGDRWECQPFHAFTEFFADFGTYDVTLTVPNTYVVAATGILASAPVDANGTRTLTYHAEDVHDFVWMADPYMEVMSGQAKVEDGTVEVRVVYRPEQKEFARRHLDAAIGAIEKFSAYFVPYPWPIMTVVDPPVDAWQGAGGMEYPTLVTTAGDSVFARPGVRLPEFVTVHEVGHNWFQGMLASNEPVEAWLDEGVNEWADARVMADLYGPKGSAIDWMGWQAEMNSLRRAVATDPSALPQPIATAAFAFVDEQAYGEATYTSTMRALRTLELTVGQTKFDDAMKAYAKKFAFKHPTGRDLFDTLASELAQDLTWFFGPVFHEVGGLELAIRSASCWQTRDPRGYIEDNGSKKLKTDADAPDTGGYLCEVVITNTGTIHVPVDIELRFADGSTAVPMPHWDDRGNAGSVFRIVERHSSPLTEVRIDPENKLWLDSPIQHAFRIDGEGEASLRAAAWFASAAQTFMQVVGP